MTAEVNLLRLTVLGALVAVLLMGQSTRSAEAQYYECSLYAVYYLGSYYFSSCTPPNSSYYNPLAYFPTYYYPKNNYPPYYYRSTYSPTFYYPTYRSPTYYYRTYYYP